MTAITHIHLELAREPGHPAGDRATGYDLFVPLDAQGRIDALACRNNRQRCIVRKFTADGELASGTLRHGPGGRWEFDYEDTAPFGDERGVHLENERFAVGEYVSIAGPGAQVHTYRVRDMVAAKGD